MTRPIIGKDADQGSELGRFVNTALPGARLEAVIGQSRLASPGALEAQLRGKRLTVSPCGSVLKEFLFPYWYRSLNESMIQRQASKAAAR